MKPIKSDLALLMQSLRGSFVYVGIFSFFVNLLMIVPPLYMLQVYNRVVSSRSEETLLMLTLIVVWMFFTLWVLEFVRSRLLVRISAKIDNGLGGRLYDTIMTMSLKYPGKGTAQPLTDLTQIRQFLSGSGPFAFFDAPWIPVYIALLFMFHSWYGWFAITAVIILIILAVVNNFKSINLIKIASSAYASSNSIVAAQLRNAEVVHAMGMSSNLKGIWQAKYLDFLTKQSQASDQAGIWSNLSKVLRALFQSLILGLGGYLVIHNEISVGMLIAGMILMGRALNPVDQMISTWRQFGNARQSYGRLNDLLLEVPAVQRALSLPAPKGDVRFENVTVMAPGAQQPVLRTINFELQAGEMLAILGPSAAGKSALARTLMGVWPVAAGVARLDNADIHQWNRDELGPHIGYLPQDIELFDGTVAENIARFDVLVPEKVHLAAEIAGVDAMIRRLPQGYDTPIGVGGVALSGGQRQRIALARALYGEPKLVVLDEPDASLDEQGEKALLKACQRLQHSDTTVVVITHKPAMLKIADKLLVLSEGQVSMFGARDSILKTAVRKRLQKQQAEQSRPKPSDKDKEGEVA